MKGFFIFTTQKTDHKAWNMELATIMRRFKNENNISKGYL
jgi:hypothetical protein